VCEEDHTKLRNEHDQLERNIASLKNENDRLKRVELEQNDEPRSLQSQLGISEVYEHEREQAREELDETETMIRTVG
jgi:hypothetical protein